MKEGKLEVFAFHYKAQLKLYLNKVKMTGRENRRLNKEGSTLS
jgi:hypothetical protein